MDLAQKQYAIVNKYKDVIKRMTKISFPELTDYELDLALNDAINKQHKEYDITVDNNYTKKQIDMSVYDLLQWINDKEPICTSYGVMFKKHGTVPNPLTKMIKMFMDNRGINKKEMFKYPKGSENFEKYNLAQLLDKIDCNSIYGAMGMPTCLFYNINVSASITAVGRSLISSATMFFEMFLSNGVKFCSLDEIILFINNVITEKDRRIFKDSDVLDENISKEDCFAKIVLSIGDFKKGAIKWIPNEEDLEIIWDIIAKLNQEDINRLYYKNNLYEFMNSSSMIKSLIYILTKLDDPFLDPNTPPQEIQVELDTLYTILKEFVYYDYQIIDRIDRNIHMIKNVCVISDTDSAIVSLDAWYRFVLDKVKRIPMNITSYSLNMIEYCDGDNEYKTPISEYEKELDFDFFADEIIERDRLITPLEIIPQDNLRYSIINIMAYIISKLSNDYMLNYTKQSHSYRGDNECLIIFKNEFLFKRALLTMNKKNYATIQEVQEGNMVAEDEKLDIKGLPLTKSTVNDKAKKELKKILYEDVLMDPYVDQVKVLKKLSILEKKIYQSLESGNKEFYKPSIIKSFSNYEDPMRIQGVKAAYIWNIVRDDNLEAIDLDARNAIDIIKVVITPEIVEPMKEEMPETYDKFMRAFADLRKLSSSASYKDEITAIAVPKDVATPKWLLKYIDYVGIVRDNISVFPIESIGISTLGQSNVNYTNIVKL